MMMMIALTYHSEVLRGHLARDHVYLHGVRDQRAPGRLVHPAGIRHVKRVDQGK